MRSIRNVTMFTLSLPFLFFAGLFVTVGLINGFDDALRISLRAPRDLFCSLTTLCGESDGNQFITEDEIYTRVWAREVLQLALFESRNTYRQTRDVAFGAEASMRMNAEVNITIGVNLELIQLDDIVVDNEAQTVTIVLPQVQPIDCFLEDVEFFDEFCLGQCDELRDDLRSSAIDEAFNSEVYQTELINAAEEAQFSIGRLIDPLTDDYIIVFEESLETPGPIAGSSCPAS